MQTSVDDHALAGRRGFVRGPKEAKSLEGVAQVWPEEERARLIEVVAVEVAHDGQWLEGGPALGARGVGSAAEEVTRGEGEDARVAACEGDGPQQRLVGRAPLQARSRETEGDHGRSSSSSASSDARHCRECRTAVFPMEGQWQLNGRSVNDRGSSWKLMEAQ